MILSIRRALVPVAGLVAVLALLGACGSSGPTDREQIATIVKQEGADPASVCNHLIDSLLARLGGGPACLHQAALAAKDPSTHATSVTIKGKTATAFVVDRTGSRTISFVKQRGVWKVSAVQ